MPPSSTPVFYGGKWEWGAGVTDSHGRGSSVAAGWAIAAAWAASRAFIPHLMRTSRLMVVFCELAAAKEKLTSFIHSSFRKAF